MSHPQNHPSFTGLQSLPKLQGSWVANIISIKTPWLPIKSSGWWFRTSILLWNYHPNCVQFLVARNHQAVALNPTCSADPEMSQKGGGTTRILIICPGVYGWTYIIIYILLYFVSYTICKYHLNTVYIYIDLYICSCVCIYLYTYDILYNIKWISSGLLL